MADNYPGLFDGAAGAEALVVNFTASEAIEIGACVGTAAAGTGELQARVQPISTLGAHSVGVVVGGDANGIWSDGTVANDGDAASAAGETVKVCVFGRCKIRVNGSTGGANSAIAIGDPITASATDEIAQKPAAGNFVIARALQATSAASDAILCFVTNEGATHATAT